MEEKKKPTKTYSREIAVILLGSLLYFGHADKVSALEYLSVPFSFFAVAAFGFKADVIKDALNARNLEK